MTASSSNIGSIAKRLVLTIWRSGGRVGRAVRDLAEDLLLLLRPGADAGLLLEVDRLPLDLVHHDVQRRLVGGAGRVALERLAVDDEGDVRDVRVRGAAVRLVRELDDGVRAVIEEPLEAGELALRVLPDPVRDLEVLAPDDRPHG